MFFRPFGTFLNIQCRIQALLFIHNSILKSLHVYNFYSIYASIMDKKCFFYPLYLMKVDKIGDFIKYPTINFDELVVGFILWDRVIYPSFV